jgi:hypothetical protein
MGRLLTLTTATAGCTGSELLAAVAALSLRQEIIPAAANRIPQMHP